MAFCHFRVVSTTLRAPSSGSSRHTGLRWILGLSYPNRQPMKRHSAKFGAEAHPPPKWNSGPFLYFLPMPQPLLGPGAFQSHNLTSFSATLVIYMSCSEFHRSILIQPRINKSTEQSNRLDSRPK
jgi:hypothetical protein